MELMKRCYTTDDLKELLHCDARYVGNLKASGLIVPLRIGKKDVYHYSEIDKLFIYYRGYSLGNLEEMIFAKNDVKVPSRIQRF